MVKRVRQMSISGRMTADSLIKEYGGTGALGAGNLAKAADILEEMLSQRATVFLSISGPLVAAGLRNVISDMIESKYASAVIASGANVVHDMIESFGGRHYAGSFRADDIELRKEEVGRIGNVLTKFSDFEVFEKRVWEILSSIDEEKRSNLSVRELLSEIGARVKDKNSFLRAAHKNGTPVFSPALIDSMLGLQLFFFSQKHVMVLNAVKDMKELAEMVFKAKKTGVIILGGGVTKHYALGANTLRNGVDYGIQITMDREEAGSVSGAKLEEGISWGKAQSNSKLVTVVGDATVLLPLLIASVKERLS